MMELMKRKTDKKKMHVLVTDHEINFLHSMEFILESAGYDVTATDNGQEAFDMILEANRNKKLFDLLITDVRMKGLTGLALLDKLRELNICIPTFVMTSYGDKNLVVELLRRGCCEYLDKPVDEAELVKRVRALLNKESKLKTRREV
jgi:DNA-binding response OmpR family regulator